MTPATYKAKTLLTGYRIGMKTPDLFVGVPAKYWEEQTITVSCRGEVKEFHHDQIVKVEEFNDKFTPGAIYRLTYLLWSKVKKGALNGKAN